MVLAQEPPHGAPTVRASKLARFVAVRCAAEGRRLRREGEVSSPSASIGAPPEAGGAKMGAA
eukprot:3178467-Alexandrium_andersonii.AAC.1